MKSVKEAKRFESLRMSSKLEQAAQELNRAIASELEDLGRRESRTGWDLVPAARLVARRTRELIEERVELRLSVVCEHPELASRPELQEVHEGIELLIERQQELFRSRGSMNEHQDALERAELIVSREAESARTRAVLALEACRLQHEPRGGATSVDDVPSEGKDPIAADRRDRVDRAIAEAEAQGITLRRKDIWGSADYRYRTQFQLWQSNHPEQGNQIGKNMDRVLRDKPWLKGPEGLK